MLQWLNGLLNDENGKIVYVLSLILIANVVDFSIGWLNAKFNPKVQFSSSKAILGIARKITLFILLVLFIPVSLLVPQPIGDGALWVLFLGYLASEINSILSHLKLASDDKSTDHFITFLQTVFRKDDKK